jgi:capsular exopolysaccharide synthesis family protein
MQMTNAYPDTPPTTRFAKDSLWGMIQRRRRLAILFGILAGVITLFGFSLIRPLYQADATLVVDRASRSMTDDDSNRQIDYSFLNTQRDLLMSDSVLSNALAATGSLLRKPYSQSADPNALLRHRLSVIVSKDSWMITVSLRDESASDAHDLLAVVLHLYAHHEIDLRQNRTRGEFEFLTHQVETERGLLTAARVHEQEFRASHNILTADPDRSPLASQLASYSVKRVELVRELDADRVVVGQMAASDAIPDAEKRTRSLLEIAEIKQDAAVSQHREELAKLQDKAVQLGQIYKSKHPRMLEITGQVAAERAQLDQAISIARRALENRERALAKENLDMSSEIKQLQADLTGYRGDLMQMEALSEERSTRERLFANLLTKLRQAEVDNRLIASQLMIIDAPHAGNQPVNIHWSLFLLATAITACIVAILAAFIADVIDRRVADADMVSSLTNLEILGNIPHVAGLQPLGNKLDPRNLDRQSVANRQLDECFNALRVNLRLGEEIDSARVLMVASSSTGEGRSMVAARLGNSLAANGLRVLLIDCDLRRPALDRQVGERCELGLSDWLNGDARVRPIPTSYTGLDIITGGSPSEPGHLQGRRLRLLIDGLRPNYDCIILDSPPINVSADALVAATVVDNLLLVIRGQHTTRECLGFALHRLGWLRQQLLGIVFNDDHRNLAGLNSADAAIQASHRGSIPTAVRKQGISSVPPARNGHGASV